MGKRVGRIKSGLAPARLVVPVAGRRLRSSLQRFLSPLARVLNALACVGELVNIFCDIERTEKWRTQSFSSMDAHWTETSKNEKNSQHPEIYIPIAWIIQKKCKRYKIFCLFDVWYHFQLKITNTYIVSIWELNLNQISKCRMDSWNQIVNCQNFTQDWISISQRTVFTF